MILSRIEWTNPARPGERAAVLCRDHTRSLLLTLRALGLGAFGRTAHPSEGTSCDQCRGRAGVRS